MNARASKYYLAVLGTLLGNACSSDPPCHDSGLEDAGLADSGLADSGLADSGLADSGLEDSGLEDAGVPPTLVCALGHVAPGFHPTPDNATVVLAPFAIAADRRIELSGPSSLEMEPGLGCTFLAAPGHYTLRIKNGAAIELSTELDLAAGQTSVLAVHGAAPTPHALVVPLDLSAPPSGRWRVVLVDLALDNVNNPLDVYRYDPGSFTPEGTPVPVATGLLFGTATSTTVPAHSLVFEDQPAGVAPDAVSYFRAIDCAAAAYVMVHVIWCDTATTGDGGECDSVLGPAYLAFSVEDIPC